MWPLDVDPVTLLYGLAILGFVVGVGLAWRLRSDDPERTARGAFDYLLVIPVVAGVSYVVMFLDIGTLTFGGVEFVLPRYIDWLITTPILVGYVGYVAGAPRRWIIGLGLADAAMITLGAVATVTTGPLKWGAFAVSALSHASLLGILYLVLPKFLPDNHKRRGLFKLLQNHVGLLWLAYPNVWLFGPAGLGLVSGVGLSLVIAYLDVIAKTPYVYFVWSNRFAFDGEGGDAPDVTGDREEPTDAPAATA